MRTVLKHKKKSKNIIYMEEEYITYVLSAHGSDDKSEVDTLEGGKLSFYVKEGDILQVKKIFQKWVCEERGIPFEVIEDGNKYSASLFFSYDFNKGWKSGLVECKTKRVIYNLDYFKQGITLKSLINNILKPYNEKMHPGKKFNLHILTCRVCTTDRSEEKIVRVKNRLPRDRSAYIKPKANLLKSIESSTESDSVILPDLIKHQELVKEEFAQPTNLEKPTESDKEFKNKYLKYKGKYLKLKKLYFN